MVATRGSTGDEFGLGNPLPAPVRDTEEGTPFVSSDDLTLYFYSTRAGGAGSRDLYVANRASTGESFSGVTALSALNSSSLDHLPWVSPDQLTIYFSSDRAGTGGTDIYRATRGSVGASFSAPSQVGELNTTSSEDGMTLSPDRKEIVFSSNRDGSNQLYRAVRASTSDPFGTPALLGTLNSGSGELDPGLTPDGSELYFTSHRNGETALWRSTRICP